MAIDLAEAIAPGWRSLVRRVAGFFVDAWSSTGFADADLSHYAERAMLEETRKGIMLMAALSLLIQGASIGLYQQLGIHGGALYTHALMALLAVHILLSSRCIHDTKALNLLGTLLLVITAVAIMSIAHRTGNLNSGLLASIVLVFIMIPVVPWGLREATIVVVLVYSIFTVSTLSVTGRFRSEELWIMQFLILATTVVATMMVVRATGVRKQNIRAQYDLEKAHRELQLLSTRDPLTGAWNRRYIDQNFKTIARRARVDGAELYLALLDVDAFKQLNDTYGHRFGDEILKCLVRVLQDNLPGTAHILRLGGDEFAILDTTENFEQSVRRCLDHLETDPQLLHVCSSPVRVSTGFAKASGEETADLERLYHVADEALYERKRARQKHMASGKWQAVPV
jgi:diguanylate cyclase (GGDEF)-like protein